MERGEGKELLIEKREIQMKYPISSKEKEERRTAAAPRRRDDCDSTKFLFSPTVSYRKGRAKKKGILYLRSRS